MFNSSRVFAAACAGMLLFGMAMLSLGTVNSFLAERFQLDQMGVGSLAALLPLGILAGSLVFGPIVDRFGYKFPLAGASLLLAAGFLLVAEAHAFPPVQMAFFVIGFGGGILNGGTNALVADISSEDRGARLSLLGVFFGIGALGMPALTGLLLHRASPTEIITGFAVAIVLPVLFILSIRFPLPKHRQGFPLGQAAAVVRDKTLLLLGMVLFFESALESLANNWTPAYLQRSGGLDRETALFMLTVLASSLTVARLVLGWTLRHVRAQAILVACLTFVCAGVALLFVATNALTAGAAMVLLGIGFAAAFPVLFSFIAEIVPSLTGTAFGVALIIALTGNMLLNYGMGIISHVWGIGVFPAYLIVCITGLGVTLLPALRSYSLRTQTPRN